MCVSTEAKVLLTPVPWAKAGVPLRLREALTGFKIQLQMYFQPPYVSAAGPEPLTQKDVKIFQFSRHKQFKNNI